MDDAVALEARRLLDRYLVEVVEAFDLCPWAASARRRGEIRVEVLVAAQDRGQLAAAIGRVADDRAASLGMVVLAGSAIASPVLRDLREALSGARPEVALADFHPDAALDLSSAPRLVTFLRRSPDPMLQVVPHRILDAVKRTAAATALSSQAAMLAGLAPAPSVSVSDQVARANLETARRDAAALTAALDDIRRDRDASYARLGRRA